MNRNLKIAAVLLGAITLAAAPTYTSLILKGSSTGTLTLKAPAAAGTGSTLTFPGHTTDFSATGGTSQVVKQTSSGGAFTVAQLACADLSDSGAGCTGSGGGGLTFTDGSHTVTGSTQLTVTGGVIGGSTPNATLTISGSSGLTINSTTISGGAANHILSDDGSKLQELAETGTGSVVLATSPSVSGLTVTGSFTATGLVTNADLANSSMTIAGHSVSLGGTQAIACADLSNGATGCSTATGTSGATIPLLNGTNVWSAQQSATPTTLSISTATFTPNGTGNNYNITLVHASCPCTLANPSGTMVAGTHGVIVVKQSSTGSDIIGTWGSQYEAPGGTSTITLSTGANAVDVLAYFAQDSTHILLAPSLNFSH